MFQLIKTKLITIMLIATIGSSVALYFQTQRLNKAQDETSIAIKNEKAALSSTLIWQDKWEQQHAKNQQFIYTIEQFKFSQDSITRKMLSEIKKNGIKINDVQQAGYISTTVDTILQSKTVVLLPDTTIDLSTPHLDNIIRIKQGVLTSKVKLENEQYLIWQGNRQTIHPPKKFFLTRWLQRRHTVTEVEVINSNPLIKTKQQRFILTSENKKKSAQ